jgi:hypothetical protein
VGVAASGAEGGAEAGKGRAESSFAPRGKWMEGALAHPLRPGNLGLRGANWGGPDFFKKNGGPMRDLNGPFFRLRTGNRRLLCEWGSNGGLLEMLLDTYYGSATFIRSDITFVCIKTQSKR